MNTSRYGMRTLAAVALACLLAWPTPILATGILRITSWDIVEGEAGSTGKSDISSWARAQYEGPLGADEGRDATLGTGVKAVGETWNYINQGYSSSEREVLETEGQRMYCDTGCGGMTMIDVCMAGYLPTQMDQKTEVTIIRSFGNWRDTKPDTHTSTKCEPPPQEEEDEPDENDGGPPGSPIILDLDRDGFHLTGIDDGVIFDIDADGVAEVLSWTRAAQLDGFLALDRNGNGVIDDGSELFGNHTLLLSGGEAAHGYLALAEFDKQSEGGNEDGSLDERDVIFSDLKVWIDFNHDGYSQEFEVVSETSFDTIARRGLRDLERATCRSRPRMCFL